ncbi:MAG: hypothetical protein JW990_11455 [Thermoleophilia bacterium]|nr:hypothetical protein [Thermoleophilia bacterium]
MAMAAELQSGRRVPVTLGFQDAICRECRGLAPEAHPKAATYGRGSKIVRYYWREIFFETTRRFAPLATAHGLDTTTARSRYADEYGLIERQVIEELKVLHQTAPKYQYQERSADAVLSAAGVDVVDLRASYTTGDAGQRLLVTPFGSFSRPEELVARHFQDHGLECMECESRPFHALFAVYMWLLIQDHRDDQQQLVQFGSRTAFDTGVPSPPVTTFLPTDFGKPGYANRRAAAIEKLSQA